MTRMELTNLGRIAVTYGAMTPPSWFQGVVREINRCADEDSDWLLMLDDRINALMSIREHARVDGLDWFTRIPNQPTTKQGDKQ